jgi:hypothetical protein
MSVAFLSRRISDIHFPLLDRILDGPSVRMSGARKWHPLRASDAIATEICSSVRPVAGEVNTSTHYREGALPGNPSPHHPGGIAGADGRRSRCPPSLGGVWRGTGAGVVGQGRRAAIDAARRLSAGVHGLDYTRRGVGTPPGTGGR